MKVPSTERGNPKKTHALFKTGILFSFKVSYFIYHVFELILIFKKYCIEILFIWILSFLVPVYILHLRRVPHSLDFNPSAGKEPHAWDH